MENRKKLEETLRQIKHPSGATKDLILKKVRFYLTEIIDKEAFPDKDDITVQMFYNEAVQRLYLNLRLLLVQNKTFSQIEKKHFYPANLWNHFKLSIAERLPNFLGQHIKIKYDSVPEIIHHYTMCPHIGVSGKKGDHIAFLTGELEQKENGRPIKT